MALTNLSLFIPAIGLLSVLFLVLRTRSATTVPKGLRLPPGPHGWPLVGNTLQLDAHPQKQLRQWAKQYGDVFSLSLGGHNWAMVCSAAAVKEIMDKQSASTSSRPPMPVLNELVSGGMRTIVMPYTPRWRTVRSVVHKLLTPKVSDTFKPSQEFEAKQLLWDYLTDNKSGAEFYAHTRRYTTSVVMTSTYGKRVASWGAKHIKEVYQVMNELSMLAIPGAFFADMFPILAKLPTWMQTWRGRALRYHKNQANIWLGLWEELQSDIKNGKAPECFVKQVSDIDLEKQGLTPEQGAWIAGTLIEAGSETTASSINSGLKLLAVNFQAQKIANEQLTKVVGEERTPNFNDEPNLQYVRAIVKEIFRMRPVATIGAAHYSTADVVYKDLFIPKDTIIALVMSVVHFDDRYEEPYAFRPERYMDHTLRAGAYAAMPDPSQRDHFGFGAGRRICPGMHLAENSVFITMAKILWAFEVRPALGPDRKEEELDNSDDAFEEGTIVVPKPFRLRFIPRSPQREKIIRQEWEAAQRDGYSWGNVKVDKNGMVS
ncbi:putative O-methylsterigmatocystin oxidoreductase [Lophium mytilinum]|uniref:Putative O-methylsterigmatocystin oxidoreductase n=1 Tax=Lophium mytilinum TaxID=390894 RepID=A0A6A6QNB4_9PEZI|nr:putative O-methylsterigmatocystin oxidoreductase [Lophium mytilinum]